MHVRVCMYEYMHTGSEDTTNLNSIEYIQASFGRFTSSKHGFLARDGIIYMVCWLAKQHHTQSYREKRSIQATVSSHVPRTPELNAATAVIAAVVTPWPEVDDLPASD